MTGPGWASRSTTPGSSTRRGSAASRVTGRAEAGGSGKHQVTSFYPGQAWSPTWAADGRQLAYVGQPAGSAGTKIWVSRTDGSSGSPITQGLDDNQPAWSPNGRFVAFIRSISRS